MTVTVTNFPFSSSFAPSPRLTERRNSLLLAPSQSSQTLTSAEGKTALLWVGVGWGWVRFPAKLRTDPLYQPTTYCNNPKEDFDAMLLGHPRPQSLTLDTPKNLGPVTVYQRCTTQALFSLTDELCPYPSQEG